MNCLECHGAMEVIEHRGIEVDRCTECGAFWFDDTEAAQYLRDAPIGRVIEKSRPLALFRSGQVCPRCHETAVLSTSYWGVSFQKCTSCSGMFFTADAIASIVAVHRPDPSGPAPFTPLDLLRLFY